MAYMDPLDIMTNLEHVKPFYQAIFSADEQKVIGYEILGRIHLEEETKSLGPFFKDESIPDEYRLEADNHILHMALDAFLLTNDDTLIFLNRDANLLMLDHGESLLEQLFAWKEKGGNLERIVIEITEHTFTGDIRQLTHVFTYYRTYGIKIAVDNVGKASSNLDRIGMLMPNILKIDIQPLRLTSPLQTYHDVLYSISLLARKIGATILYEEIEVNFQFQYAWKNGGRYFQGDYLQTPKEEFIEPYMIKEKMTREFHGFIQYEKKKLQQFYEISEAFHQKVHVLISKENKPGIEFDELITKLSQQLSDCCFRIYICDGDGFQQSGNILKLDGAWEFQPGYYMKNWSWRPYFLENIMKMQIRKKGFFSDLYSDIETGETIRTFSYPIDQQHYLFLDLPYSYLYENEALL
ncbi:EAL-associated domain-containing protein [Peribacillus frigoritolerans]|uniref:EAL-associated domain-containing protein n=1 Tax=Peribacillus frigoritolerans TaxID=450367 RepID=UPI00256FA8CD|nr:EAL-associated domain-containing protein [Peribacillus frigoritolerans]